MTPRGSRSPACLTRRRSGRSEPAPRRTPASLRRSSRPPAPIGYVEQAYALQNGFTYAAVKNSSGNFVTPTLQAASAAATGSKVPANLAISTINAPGAATYPITSQTFLIVYKDMCKAGRTSAEASSVKKFLTYGLGAGQKVEEQLDYAPLPGASAGQGPGSAHAAELQRIPGLLGPVGGSTGTHARRRALALRELAAESPARPGSAVRTRRHRRGGAGAAGGVLRDARQRSPRRVQHIGIFSFLFHNNWDTASCSRAGRARPAPRTARSAPGR